MDSRIGKLSNGNYYAYANGYDKPPVIGTLQAAEKSLGLTPSATTPIKIEAPEFRDFVVKVITDDSVVELTICELTHGRAISKAREWYADEYGPRWLRQPAKFSCKLAKSC